MNQAEPRYECACGSTGFHTEVKVINGNDHVVRICNDCEKSKGFVRSVSNEEFKMPFGKHKGAPLKELIQNEPDYVSWLMKTIDSGNLKRRITELQAGGN